MIQRTIAAVLVFVFTTVAQANSIHREFSFADANVKTTIDFPLSLGYIITVPDNQGYTSQNRVCSSNQIDFNPLETKFHKTECGGYHFYFIWKETTLEEKVHYDLTLSAKNLRSVPTGVSSGKVTSSHSSKVYYQYGHIPTTQQPTNIGKNSGLNFSLGSQVSIFDFYIVY